jgi:L-glutamine:2-deoxy-scyllo-inosose/3-amino-2,3-dideoxy-scyllo-inosose aminotransferase
MLALLGGTPVCDDFIGSSQLVSRPDLERKFLVEAYDSGVWDDWHGVESAASAFADEWAEFNGSAYCALVTNGTHTLQLALEALDIGYGDEVIVPGLTWQATASAVCDVNAVPVIVDVDPTTLAIDPVCIEEAITGRTKAVIPVHLYHRMADMDAISELASRHGIAVIEDCAHSHGSTWEGRGSGTLSAFGSFSFQRSKLINGGEGGALLTQDEDLFKRIVSLRSCGREYDGIKLHSGNFRLSAFQGAVMRGQLAALAVNADIFDQTGRAFDDAVRAAPGVAPLRRNEKITRQCSYGFAFLFDSSQFDGVEAVTFRKALKSELGVGFGTCYAPLNRSEVYKPHTKNRQTPLARKDIRPE